MALKNLNNVEALEIFKNNNGLRCKVYADAIENEAYYGDGLQVDETGAVYETITTTKIYK